MAIPVTGVSTQTYTEPKIIPGASGKGQANEGIKPQEIKKLDLFERLDKFFTKKLKNTLNFYINSTASILNFLPFITSNLNIMEFLQEKFEFAGEYGAKTATICQGILNSVDCLNKRNAIPACGAFLELPIAAIASSENLWTLRGFGLALWNLAKVMQERILFNSQGEKIPNEKGGIKTIGGNFKEQGKGFIDGIKTNLQEIPKIVRELVKEPRKIKELSYGLFTSSCLQFLGAFLALFGFKRLGATSRNIGAIGVDLSFTQDKDLPNLNKKNKAASKGMLNLDSSFVKAGLIWIFAAIADWIHHFGFLADKVKNIQNSVQAIDRLASSLNAKGVCDMTTDKKSKP